MKLEEYVETFTQSQKLIFQHCLNYKKGTVFMDGYCQKLTKDFLIDFVEFWGDALPEFDQMRMGFMPNWLEIDVDWDATFSGIWDCNYSPISWFLSITGLDMMLINNMLGLNLPPKLPRRKDRISIGTAIYAAALIRTAKMVSGQ